MQKGVAIYPQNDAILSLLSAAYRLQGDYIQAATYATQALSINTYNILAHRENAYILRQNGDIAGANTEAQYVLSVTDDAIWKDEMTKLIGEMTSI
jgi:tetratricopeptide (TPR) repeat protein